jgi:EAL domain-containing protein (putative c-di-GMP-specific phosphodiesterase class I)
MSTASEPIQPRLGELRFMYQPVVSLREEGDGWSEALVRWQLPDGTVRGPLDVLPHWLAAPRQAAFTQYTFAQAAAALGAAPDAHVAVNLSPTQALHPVTLAALGGLLPDVRSRLRVEITEQRVRDRPALDSALAAIRERCAAVLLDDVTERDLDLRSRATEGVDGVKLDRSVVGRLFAAGEADETRRFVLAACDRFPIVVAEGIEDAELCEALATLGVSHVQGFGIARPRSELAGTYVDRRVPFRPPAPEPAALATSRRPQRRRGAGGDPSAP